MSKKNVRGKLIGSRFLRHHPDLDLDPQLAIIIPGSTHEMNSLIRCQHMHKLMHTMNNLTNAKLRYVPNLNRFAVPHGSERLVLIKLSAEHHPHSPDAAKLMKEEDACICFELPVDRFPVHAPIGRIMFLSPKLLPRGISVGGVFGPGVLPHKFYPIGMLSSQHKGPTPPLFVGRRVLKEIMRGLATELITPLSATIGKSSAEAQLRLSSCNVALGFVGADPNTIAIMKRYLDNPLPTQYNIYVPDLTNMRVVMATEADALMPYAMTVISTVVQPHVPSVSMATMNSPGPKFKLPEELFPPKIIAREPVFLPTRFLPKNFEVGCVFAPGALPYTWFHGLLVPDKAPLQHSPMMSPPLFFGRWKAKQQKLSGGGNLPPRQSVPLLSNLLASKLSVSNLPASTFSASYTSVTNPLASKPSISNPSASQPSIPTPSVSQPSIPTPSVSQPSISNPSVSKPSISNPSASQTSIPTPSVSQPSISNPSVSQPSISNPSVSNPSVSNPSVSQPSIPTPSVSQPSISNSSVSKTSISIPSVSQPSVPKPLDSQPSISNLLALKPSISKPSISNPSFSNPSMSNPSALNPPVTHPSVWDPSVSMPPSSGATEKELMSLIFSLYGSEKEIEVGAKALRRLTLELLRRGTVSAGLNVDLAVDQYRAMMRKRAAKRDGQAPPLQIRQGPQPRMNMAVRKRRLNRRPCSHCGEEHQ